MRLLLFGGTGTIGQAVAKHAVSEGFELVCYARGDPGGGCDWIRGSVTDRAGLCTAFASKPDIVVSCLASRTGVSQEAWEIDYQAHLDILHLAQDVGVAHFIQLSAICVQKPKRAFQHAKRAFDQALAASGLRYSIVRPTAFFKSLSGQVARVKRGKPYLMFGDGQLTRCKPISDRDLATYVLGCVQDKARWNAVLPVGGPGGPVTPLMIGQELHRLAGRAPRFRRVTPKLLPHIASGLDLLGLKQRAEYARIGHYYATESMLVWTGARYDAEATPAFGQDLFFDYLADQFRDTPEHPARNI